MQLRKYCEEDLNAIEKINPFFALQIRYHKGISAENIFCVIENNAVIGAGFLTLHKTLDENKKLKITFSTIFDTAHRGNIEADGLLTDGLIQRFHEFKKQNPKQEFYMKVCCETDEINDMQFFLNKGFDLHAVIPVLKYDLTQNTVHHQIPADVKIQKYTFNELNMKKYLEADLSASADFESEADTWFSSGDPSFACYAATCNDEVIGAISVWNISNERAATENIFVVPSFRRKNIARELIATAFDVLKERNMKIATLSMYGTNLSAMKLYLSCGFTLYYNLIEMTYE